VAPPPEIQTSIGGLPRDHVVVLRAALSGFDVEELAALAGVPTEAVVPLLQVAVAKLGHALADTGAGGGARAAGPPPPSG
jgi:DNA-directed RNA polymerase specialized sigma24 family protein